MTRVFAAPTEQTSSTQKTGEDLLTAVQKESGSADIEELLQNYRNELSAVLVTENRTEKYTYEKLIESLAENQIRLDKNQATLQQQIHAQTPPAADNFGGLFSFLPFIACGIVLVIVLVMLSIYSGKQSNALKKKQDQIDKLREQVESLDNEIKLLRNAERNRENSFRNPPPERPRQISFAKETFPTEDLISPPQTAVPAPPKSSPEDKEKIFLKDFNGLIAEMNTPRFRTTRAEFIRKYSVKAFSCENAQDRMNNPNLPPIFSEVTPVSNGDFWAYRVDNIYLVVPLLNGYNDNLHVERAMGEVFDSNFSAGKSYDKVFVEKAARFHEGWKKESKGMLRLS
ncbi:MAG: hypothetical protein IJG32_06240 [Selenomonadaceae bacterium]|nr:hypothetical protein [Selenomonadaceae bacterium]